MEAAHESDPEPFGQRGVTPMLWPTFVVLCAIGLCTSLAMLVRSWDTWDSVINTTPNRQTIVASVIGRLVIDIVPTGTNPDISNSVWDFDSRTFDSIQDGWADSWKKSIGIEWGEEAARRFNQRPVNYWRLRIRWRTLAVLYAIPVVIELGRRVRKHYRQSTVLGHAIVEPTT